MGKWIPLHVHSQYSILNSTASIKDLIAKAKKQNIEALGLTDSGNMFGAIDFYKTAVASSIQPIMGLELMIAPADHKEKKKQYGVASGYPIVLLAKNYKGYQNLCKLSSIGYLEGFYYTPRVDKQCLQAHCDGLICLSGPSRGRIANFIGEDQIEAAKEEVEWFKRLFGIDYYLQIERHKSKDFTSSEAWLFREYEMLVAKQEKVIHFFKEWSKTYDIPLVATNDIQYLDKQDWQAHEILMNIQSGEPCEILELDYGTSNKHRTPNPKRKVLFSHEYFFKSEDEMLESFFDIPEALTNTLEIKDKCHIEFDFKKKYYPIFIPPCLENKSYTQEEREVEAQKYLRQLAEEGVKKRYDDAKLSKVKEIYKDQDPLDVVKKRLEYELGIITSKGMSDYLLIVHDFIAWAKGQNIPVGPGRGSGVGSIILYLIGITDIEPLRFHLFFERFINPERISYPDIDVDICMEKRPLVIEYTLSKYGKDKVAQIITFGTMKAKMAIKDIGRVLSVPLAKVNEIAKLVPEDLNITLEKALDIDPDFKKIYDIDEEARRIIDYGMKLEGTVRNTGIHAAGLIISAEPLTDLIPICNSKDSELVATQFAMKPLESVGLLKIDFLGLKTLTSIQKTVDAIHESKGIHIDWVNLPLDNKETFNLLNQGKTSGIFQLESSGMQELVKQLHIDRFEEIIAVGSLYRPGPMEMIPSFIRRKHKLEEMEIDHPLMKDILAETYGIIVYQEQVMQIAESLAGYSLGEGDVLRKAMGKKDHQEMANQAKKFTEGAKAKGLDAKLAMHIFEKVEKFASYGFNKSHATAYGYLSYITAYLKANYPKEWMAAVMTCDIVDLTKISKHTNECHSLHIDVLTPDVNESKGEFVAIEKGIRFALSAIKGIGDGVVEAIVEERQKGGAFASLIDFVTRLDPHRIGKKGIEVLIQAGAFDFTKEPRGKLLAILEHRYDTITSLQKEKAKGVLDFFGFVEEKKEEETLIFEETDPLAMLHKEKELLGFYLTGHPLDAFKDLLCKLEAGAIIKPNEASLLYVVKAACIIESVQTKISSKSGKKFAILTLSDRVQRYEVLIFSDLFDQTSHLFIENKPILAVLVVDAREDPPRLQCKALFDLSKILEDNKLSQVEHIFAAARDFAKMEAQRRQKQRSSSFEGGMNHRLTASKTSQHQEGALKKMTCRIDTDKIRLSDILHLRKMFLEHPGKHGIEIEFFCKNQKIAALDIDASRGVDMGDVLEQKLQAFSWFKM